MILAAHQPDSPRERWRVIPGTGQRYWVSDQGRIWSRGPDASSWGGGRRGGCFLKFTPHRKGGYPMVGLFVDGKKTTRTVHSLVAEAFLGPRPAGLQVRHMNGPTDNRATMLAYGTQKENEADKRVCPRCGYRGDNDDSGGASA